MPIAVLSALALVAVVFVLVRLVSRSGAPPIPTDDPGPAKPTGPGNSAQPRPGAPSLDTAAVLALVRAGQKISAIKLYREQTGAGLAEAKTAVEALEEGKPLPASSLAPRPAPAADEAEVRRLAKAGELIMAIKLHRQITGLGLAESKAAVEKLRDGP